MVLVVKRRKGLILVTMKGTILNQTMGAITGAAEAVSEAVKELGATGGAAEAVLEVAKEYGQEVVVTAGGVLADMLKSSVSGGGDINITR